MMLALKSKRNQLQSNISKSQLEGWLSSYYESELKMGINRLFGKMQDRVLSELEVYYSTVMYQANMDLILAPIQELHKEYYDLLMKYKLREFRKSRDAGKRIVSYMTHNAFKASVTDNVKTSFLKQKELFGTMDEAEQNLADRTYKLSEKTLSRVDNDINNIIATGYNEGWGTREVAERINKRFNQLKDWESERIARTEIHQSHNMGMMQGYHDMDVEYIEWSSAHDNRVRGLKKTDTADHYHLDGEIIRMGDVFSNGLSYPGDMTGPASEVINCRCVASPFIIPDGYTAPAGMTQFREKDLVKVDVQPIEELTTQNNKPKQDVDNLVNNVLGDILSEYGIEGAMKPTKPKKPKPKAKPKPVKTKPTKPSKPKTEQDKLIDDVLGDVLDDYGLTPKPKIKSKKKPSKTKTKLKPVPQTEPTIQTKDITDKQLKQHLRNELPSDFTDESLDYLVKKIRRRGPRKQEYGEIFDFKTGKPTSPEFKGGNNSVAFKEEGWIKNPKQMTIKEMEDALNNPSKYKKNYVNNSNSLATQHNHPSNGSRCFSGQDIKCTSHNKWEDYGFAISENEMWLCERKGSLNALDADTIKRDMDKLWTKAKTKANREISNYDVNRDNRAELKFELTQENYSNFVLDYFKKNPQYGVKVKRIKYAEAVLV